MYAHELIENIETYYQHSQDEIDKLSLKKLKSAQHFHLGSFADFGMLCKNMMNTKDYYFMGALGMDVKSPFENITIQYNMTENDYSISDIETLLCPKKIVISISQYDDGQILQILRFDKNHNEKKWSTNNFILEVDMGILPGIRLLTPKGFKATDEDKKNLLKSTYTNSTIWAVNAFLMLINTKNITTINNSPPSKLNKKRIKNGKQPLFTYKTLRLQLPAKKRKKGEGPAKIGDNTTRLHLCRGHFKTYTEDAPLLGRFTGRYWWQPHARGNVSEGVVAKDYKVVL